MKKRFIFERVETLDAVAYTEEEARVYLEGHYGVNADEFELIDVWSAEDDEQC